MYGLLENLCNYKTMIITTNFYSPQLRTHLVQRVENNQQTFLTMYGLLKNLYDYKTIIITTKTNLSF